MFRWSRRAIEYSNDDDSEGLPSNVRALLRQRAQQVYEAEIDLYDSQWRSVGSLSALIDQAITKAGKDTRPLRAMLRIKGVTMTQINGILDDQECELYLIGPDDTLESTVPLWNLERIALVGLAGLLLVLVIVIIFILL